MSKFDWRDIARRSAKTFAQTFIASLPIGQIADQGLDGFTVSVVLSAAAAGVAAVWNVVLSPKLK